MTLTKEEKRWRAESDARTLVEAEVISSDSSRKSAALKELKRMAKEAQEAAGRMKKVANSKNKKKK